jgi:3,4-dihydroxy 2-butanone 4-phosphate synthase/GTP cyclohydrolase II
LAISGETSLTFTHLLRASHDAILVGVGTVLADNPRLTVRLVEGVQPQPIILDSKLRTPSDARCLTGPRPAWVATTAVDFAQRAAVEATGGRVFHLPADEQGQVDLLAFLQMVAANGIRSIMVEGGGTVINSFLQQRLANNAVVTIAPRFIGGLHVLATKATGGVSTSLRNPNSFQLGEDLILHGQLTHRSQGMP